MTDQAEVPHSADKGCSLCIAGAEGYLGRLFTEAFPSSSKIVFRNPYPGETAFADSASLLQKSDVVINVTGFRVRPGLSSDDYFNSHVETTRMLAESMPASKLLIHFSSGCVMGAGRRQPCGPDDPSDPETFPIPAYAKAKEESERVVRRIAEARGFRHVFLRPGIIYSPGGESFVSTLCHLVRKKGCLLRLKPGSAINHFCSYALLLATIRAIIERHEKMHGQTYMVADPFQITNDQLFDDIRDAAGRHGLNPRELPVPVRLLASLLKFSWHSRTPRLDLKTYGGIFGVLALDSVYDSEPLFSDLKLPRTQFDKQAVWRPMIEAEIAK